MDERTATGHELETPAGLVTAIHRGESSEACLVEVYGLEPGTRHDLSGEVIAIGRGSENAIVVELDSVSRVHARINALRGRYTLEDLMSTNGTYRNGQPVEEEVELRHGDTITVGSAIYRFFTGERLESDYRQEIYHLHIIDGLTGLYNRRYFREALGREVARGQRYQRELAVVLFALDNFDRLVDEFGRIAVEHVLEHVCQAIAHGLRPEELAARLAENQYALLLPEHDPSMATTAAERLRQLVEGCECSFEGDEIPITASAGVATLAIDDSDETLLRRATKALGAALSSGPAAIQVAGRK